MSISSAVREQLISSFRAELAEHLQTITDGLLALEQGTLAGEERQATLENIFRAAHSLKGAARAMGVTMVEQLAHLLESVLDRMQNNAIELAPELFNALYATLDAIRAVQKTYETGEVTPPLEALQALTNLSVFIPEAEATQEAAEQPGSLSYVAAPLPSNLSPGDETRTNDSSASGQDSPGQISDETIRVSISKLDALMAQLNELLVTKIRAEQRLLHIREFQDLIAIWQREWLTARSAHSRLLRHAARGTLGKSVLRPGPIEGKQNASIFSGEDGIVRLGKDVLRLLEVTGSSQEHLRKLNTELNDLVREYANDTSHMSLVIDELEEEVKRVRMLPLGTITGSFGRMVRDLARESGKDALLKIVGGETELDKKVLEQIKDPLIHLIRNAVDHGIETPEKRKKLGKPERGTITLSAEQVGKDIVIILSDDGSGLDIDAVRQKLIQRGGVDANSLTEMELAYAIFNVGISTSPIITDISGRGIGLDVVRRNVESLHGQVDVDWKPDKGSSFTLSLPLSLTSSRGLLVRVSQQSFALPINSVEYIVEVFPHEVSFLEGQDTVRYKEQPIQLVRLNDVLELARTNTQDNADRISVVILTAAERRMAFAVDRLVGEQEMVIKPLGNQLVRVSGISGATVLGDGTVIPILNVSDLIKLASRGERRSVLDTLADTSSVNLTNSQKRILIVDDSITTRTLEKNILEAAGYIIELATDGQEALGAIGSNGVPDLVVSDVAMPRMDGFELTKKLKADSQTAHVLVILVTSLDSPEDKTQGIDSGADAYIIKSSFDQNNLLETIEQLI